MNYISRQLKWQEKQAAAGNCRKCGKPAARRGTATLRHCEAHLDYHKKWQRRRRQKIRGIERKI